MRQIVTAHNVASIEYSALVDLLHPIYCKEIPETSLTKTPDLHELESLTVFFSNHYAYVVELWAVMAYEVRFLKRTSKNKEVIDEAVGSRDYLEKVMSATKLKYYSSSRLLKHYGETPR